MTACFFMQLRCLPFHITKCGASAMVWGTHEEQCKALKQNKYVDCTCVEVAYNDSCWKYFHLKDSRECTEN